ncbi:hypothetical protein G7078_10025 [Sphingomonas sinipercae]|uniref:Uncharacterized protein n=1 Tax=Sphingomonas sinipercae TaxID=2714944 RepID=A0A6G7ZQ33_9SPHN|nr:hypothetical protein [Sphingomonas sinipercae]QIL03081.1 hypothetical protein G7078_10025 [Sphingomonas sinipercae]
MSVRSFRSVFMVGGVASAALSCYLVSLRVASERAAVEDVETQIAIAQRDIRLLQTEIGTRGRLAQLERWNVKVLALSAPAAEQFVADGFTLAKLTTPEHKVEMEAPVVYASAPAEAAPGALATPEDRPAVERTQLMHEASLKTGPSRPRREREKTTVVKPAEIIAALKAAPKPASPKAEKKAEAAAKAKPETNKPTAVAAKAKAVAAKPKPAAVKVAAADPLAPLASGKSPSPKKKPANSATGKDSGKAR